MMRVLYIGGFCMPDGNAAAQRVLGIAKAMRDCGCEVRLCGLSRNITSQCVEGEIEGFKYIIYRYPNSIVSWIKYLSGYDASLLEIEKFRPQIVVLYNHPSFAIEHIVRYCHKNNIRTLADVTEWYEPHGNVLFKVIKGYDCKRRMYKSHLKLDGLICISRYLTEFYKKYGINVVEIPPLVDIEQSKWHLDEVSSSPIIKIVYAGSPGTNKDRLDLILKSMDEVVQTLKEPVQFDIIGLTKEQYVSTWGETAAHNYAIFHGRMEHNEVIKKLVQADFQIILRPDTRSNIAGFPTKFVETITSRTLPITNLSSNLKDYFKDGETGFAIETLQESSIKTVIGSALSTDFMVIQKMKQNLDNAIFDYRQYVDIIHTFIKSLY